MNSKNSEASDPQRLLLNLSDKINLTRSEKCVALFNFSIYYTWKNIKESFKNYKFKISWSTWNGNFEFTDGSYSVLDIQGYFGFIIKNDDTYTDNPAINIICK